MRKKSHKVIAKMSVELPKNNDNGSGLTLIISRDDEKLGELEIGQGSIGWQPRDGKNECKKIPWTKFAEWANERWEK